MRQPARALGWMLLAALPFPQAGTLVLRSIDEDISVGKELNRQILNDPRQYPVLSESDHPESYEFLNF